jgi:HPt (histidine-containing phosphotransfer) domain-containing protein
MTGPGLIDDEVIADLTNTIGEAGARSVIALFIAECATYLAPIAEAAGAPDDLDRRDNARRAAHAFRSGAGQVGAAAAAAAAFAVEQAAADHSPELANAIAALQTCAAATTAALRERLNR